MDESHPTGDEPRVTKEEWTLRIGRRFEVSQLRVFQLFTDPRYLTQWWGPTGYQATEAEVDLKPGGNLRIAMISTAGDNPCELSGRFEKVVLGETLVFSWCWSTPGKDEASPAVIVDFFALDERARALGDPKDRSAIEITHGPFSGDEIALMDTNCRRWEAALARLPRLQYPTP